MPSFSGERERRLAFFAGPERRETMESADGRSVDARVREIAERIQTVRATLRLGTPAERKRFESDYAKHYKNYVRSGVLEDQKHTILNDIDALLRSFEARYRSSPLPPPFTDGSDEAVRAEGTVRDAYGSSRLSYYDTAKVGEIVKAADPTRWQTLRNGNSGWQYRMDGGLLHARQSPTARIRILRPDDGVWWEQRTDGGAGDWEMAMKDGQWHGRNAAGKRWIHDGVNWKELGGGAAARREEPEPVRPEPKPTETRVTPRVTESAAERAEKLAKQAEALAQTNMTAALEALPQITGTLEKGKIVNITMGAAPAAKPYSLAYGEDGKFHLSLDGAELSACKNTVGDIVALLKSAVKNGAGATLDDLALAARNAELEKTRLALRKKEEEARLAREKAEKESSEKTERAKTLRDQITVKLKTAPYKDLPFTASVVGGTKLRIQGNNAEGEPYAVLETEAAGVADADTLLSDMMKKIEAYPMNKLLLDAQRALGVYTGFTSTVQLEPSGICPDDRAGPRGYLVVQPNTGSPLRFMTWQAPTHHGKRISFACLETDSVDRGGRSTLQQLVLTELAARGVPHMKEAEKGAKLSAPLRSIREQCADLYNCSFDVSAEDVFPPVITLTIGDTKRSITVTPHPEGLRCTGEGVQPFTLRSGVRLMGEEFILQYNAKNTPMIVPKVKEGVDMPRRQKALEFRETEILAAIGKMLGRSVPAEAKNIRFALQGEEVVVSLAGNTLLKGRVTADDPLRVTWYPLEGVRTADTTASIVQTIAMEVRRLQESPDKLTLRMMGTAHILRTRYAADKHTFDVHGKDSVDGNLTSSAFLRVIVAGKIIHDISLNARALDDGSVSENLWVSQARDASGAYRSTTYPVASRGDLVQSSKPEDVARFLATHVLKIPKNPETPQQQSKALLSEAARAFIVEGLNKDGTPFTFATDANGVLTVANEKMGTKQACFRVELSPDGAITGLSKGPAPDDVDQPVALTKKTPADILAALKKEIAAWSRDDARLERGSLVIPFAAASSELAAPPARTTYGLAAMDFKLEGNKLKAQPKDGSKPPAYFAVVRTNTGAELVRYADVTAVSPAWSTPLPKPAAGKTMKDGIVPLLGNALKEYAR